MHFQRGHRFWCGLAVVAGVVTLTFSSTEAFGQTEHRHGNEVTTRSSQGRPFGESGPDPAHDVVKVISEQGDTPAPHNKTADIVHVSFFHKARQVVTSMHLRAYGGHWGYTGVIKTPTTRYNVLGTGHGTRKHFRLHRTLSGPAITCKGLSAKVDGANETFRISVPTTCLHRPRWVQMGVGYAVRAKTGFLADDGLRTRLRPSIALTVRLGT